MLVTMTYARSQLIPPGSPETFHCVSKSIIPDTHESESSDTAFGRFPD